MLKAIFILSLFLLSYCLTHSAKIQSDDDKRAMPMAGGKEDQSDMSYMDLMAAMVECNETFRVEMSYLETLNQSGSFPDETEKTPMCYIRCVLEKTDVVSDEGSFDPERAGAVLAGQRMGASSSEVKNMATGCAMRHESEKCDRAYQFMKCLIEMEIEKYDKH